MLDPTRLDRRAFLAASAALAAGAAAQRLLGESAVADPRPGLVIRNPRPLDAEAPLEALRGMRTPNQLFFVRSHFGPPQELPGRWTLSIDGDVTRPRSFSLAELGELARVTQPVTLECAGNGRALLGLPSSSGVQWERGAVSTATWSGVRLANVLERVGMRPGARHLWMEAADSAGGQVPKFLRSIPYEVALRDAMLVWEMNGEPLPLLHGGPLRLIVPGWYGMASTKWLTHIHARPLPSDNTFMAKGYRYADGSPVERMKVKSVITEPLAGQRLRGGTTRVAGMAWSGGVAISAVELSSDGGRSWRQARLTEGGIVTAWRRWEFDLPTPHAGRYSVRARATDATGAVQPEHAEANPGGYGNNAIHEVTFHVG